MNIRLIALLACTLIQGCTQVDDYMFGKDNTPKPKDLKPIEAKMKVTQNWSSSVGKAHKKNDYLKIKPVIRGCYLYR